MTGVNTSTLIPILALFNISFNDESSLLKPVHLLPPARILMILKFFALSADG